MHPDIKGLSYKKKHFIFSLLRQQMYVGLTHIRMLLVHVSDIQLLIDSYSIPQLEGVEQNGWRKKK